MVDRARSTLWYYGLSAYWFATSFKWFILLVAVLAGQARGIVEREAQQLAAGAGFPNLPVAEAMQRFGEGANSAWGTVFGIGAFWAIIGPSLFGWLSDRSGKRGAQRKSFIALGAALTVVALMVLRGADSIVVLIIGYVLLQVSDDVGTGPYGALIPELVPEDSRGRASGAMGFMQLAAQIGSAVMGFVLGSVEMIYIGIALVNVVCAVITVQTLRTAPAILEENIESTGDQGFIKGWMSPWKSPDFRWVWFTRFLISFGFYLVQPYLLNYLVDRVAEPLPGGVRPSPDEAVFHLFGLTITGATQGSLAIALSISLFGAIGALWAAKVTDRMGRKSVIKFSGTLMGAVLVPFALVPEFGVIMLMSIGFGFGYGAYLSADWALAADVMPNKAEMGKDMGVWTSSVSAVQVFTGASGRAIDAGNRYAAGMGYTGSILLAAVAFFIGTILIKKVRGST